MPRRPATATLVLGVTALAAGIAIGAMDSRPGFDDTGVTVTLLVLAAGVVAAIDGRRPWLWALLVGAPLPIIEVPSTGSSAPLVALLFAAIGASIGVIVRRAPGWSQRPS